MRRGVIAIAFLVLAFPASAGAFGPLSSFGAFGEGAGQLSEPGNVAVAPDGTAYVADYGNNRIDVFAADGSFVRAFGEGVVNGVEGLQVCTTVSGCTRGKQMGEIAGAMNEPEDVTIGPEGNLYVADSSNERIDVFTLEGGFVRAFGEEVEPLGGSVCTAASGCVKGIADSSAGALWRPEGVGFGPKGDLYVADSENNRVSVFTPAGAFLRAFGKEVEIGGGDICTTECQAGEATGAAAALNNPTAVAIDASGNVYVADTGNNRIAEFAFAGTFVRNFGEGVLDGAEAFEICSLGSECHAGLVSSMPGSIQSPYGVATDCRGAVYASEEGTGFARVERFGEPSTALPPCPASESTGFPSGSPHSGAPSNKFRMRIRLHEDGTATVVVAPEQRFVGGTVLLRGHGVHTDRAHAHGCRHGRRCPRTVIRLEVRCKGSALRRLEQTGAVEVRIAVTFTPIGGASRTKRATVALRTKPAR